MMFQCQLVVIPFDSPEITVKEEEKKSESHHAEPMSKHLPSKKRSPTLSSGFNKE